MILVLSHEHILKNSFPQLANAANRLTAATCYS